MTQPTVPAAGVPSVNASSQVANVQKIITSSHGAGTPSALASQSLNIQLKNVKLMSPAVHGRQDIGEIIVNEFLGK